MLFFAASALFHVHYMYCATLLGSVGLHALLLERKSVKALLIVGGGVVLVNLP